MSQEGVVGAASVATADRTDSGWGALLAGLIRRVPESLRDRFGTEVERGRAAAAAGTVVHDADAEQARVEIAERQAQIRAAALDAAIPPGREAARAGLAALDPDQHPDGLARWLADPHALMLVLAGRTGAGKSFAALALAAEAALRGAAVEFARRRPLLVRRWTVDGYLSALRPDGSPEPGWLIRHRASTAELLILDDLGAGLDGPASEHARRELTELLSGRLEAGRRTVVTTNLQSAEVRAMYGDQVLSRLTECATALLFLGSDRRQAGRDLGW
jgi:Mrp family chromosome partitioning ATPase